MKIIRLLAVPPALASAVGCGGTAEVSLAMRGAAAQSTISTRTQALTAAEITFSEVKLVLGEVEIETESEDLCSDDGPDAEDASGDADEAADPAEASGEEQEGADEEDDSCAAASEGESEFAGPILVDLLAGTLDPEPPPVALPAGAYAEVELGLDADSDHLGAGTSLLVKGSWQSPNGPIDFELRSSSEESFEIESEGGLAFDPGQPRTLLVAFDLDAWFVGVDLATATVGGDGVIRLDEANNAALRARIEENIEASADCDAVEDDGDEGEDDAEDGQDEVDVDGEEPAEG